MLARLDCNQLVSELMGTGYSELEPGSITALTRLRELVARVDADASTVPLPSRNSLAKLLKHFP